jgi:hypothetical protein
LQNCSLLVSTCVEVPGLPIPRQTKHPRCDNWAALPLGATAVHVSSISINRALGRSLAGVSPKINGPFLRIAINIIQLRIREIEFLNSIERVV